MLQQKSTSNQKCDMAAVTRPLNCTTLGAAYLSETSALHSDSTLAIAIDPLGPSPFSLRLHVGQQQSGCCAIALEHVSAQCKTIPSPPPDVANAACCLVVSRGAAS